MADHHWKNLRNLLGVLKDTTSVAKATLSPKRNAKVRIAVLRATTHDLSTPPSEYHVTSILSVGRGSRHCVRALMYRLHHTSDASVALKCLFIVHAIVTKGSFLLKDQLTLYPSFQGANLFNLSKFRDDSSHEMWEFSSWVRWYAAILEQNLTVSRFLGYYLSTPLSNNDKEEKVFALPNKDLLQEVDALVGFVEVTSEIPDSLHLQRNDLIFKLVRLVAEDYKLVHREIFLRVKELGVIRISRLNATELAQFLDSLKKLEDCRERSRLLFVNKNRQEILWDLVGETKTKIVMEMKERGERKRLMGTRSVNDSNELIQFREWEQLARFNPGNLWMDMDRSVHLALATVI